MRRKRVVDDELRQHRIAADVPLARRVQHLRVELPDHVAQIQIAIDQVGHVAAADVAQIAFVALGHERSATAEMAVMEGPRSSLAVRIRVPISVVHRVEAGLLPRNELGRGQRAVGVAIAIAGPTVSSSVSPNMPNMIVCSPGLSPVAHARDSRFRHAAFCRAAPGGRADAWSDPLCRRPISPNFRAVPLGASSLYR